MKIFIDTNVLLDVFLERNPYYENSVLIWGIAESKMSEVLVSAISINNIYYIIRKHKGKELAQRAVEVLNANFMIVPLDQSIIGKAIMARLPDFEDSIQFFSALSAGADCIVTRNARDFPQSNIPVITPDAFISQYPV